jgi:hypothetical protein
MSRRAGQSLEPRLILCEKNEAIFIHVPKCAGTSLKQALEHCGFRKILLDLDVEDVRTGFFRLGTAARMQRHLDPDFWRRSVKFAVCRNPYDRLVSAWSFCRAGGQLDAPFDYFVRNMASYRAYWVEWHCTMPQLQHLLIDGVPVADHVLRFERLDEDFEVIRRLLGRPDLRLPYANRSPHAPYQEHYTRELQDLAFEHFAPDFAYFGYDYEL